MLSMTPEEVLARLMDLKVRDPEEYEVVVALIRAADRAAMVPRAPRTRVVPSPPKIRITQK